MITVKKFFALGIFMLAGVLAHAQKVTVTTFTIKFDGQPYAGYATELTGSLEEVNTSLTKYLKDFGKVKSMPGAGLVGNKPFIIISEPQLGITKYSDPFYAWTRVENDKSIVWLGAKKTQSDSVKDIRPELEKLVYNFGVKFYKDKIQVDVDESIRAQTAAERQQQRLGLEGKNLASRLEMNKKEKIRLEKALAINKQDSVKLVTSLAKNKVSSDSVAVATEQIKKMVEAHKERQRKVN
jgi:hypothetical protein